MFSIYENNSKWNYTRTLLDLMKRRFKTRYFIPILIFVLHHSHGEINTIFYTGDLLYQADSLYSNGHYSEALEKYDLLDKDVNITRDEMMEFRIAYSKFKVFQFDSSAEIFYRLWRKNKFLPEFSHFFIYRINDILIKGKL